LSTPGALALIVLLMLGCAWLLHRRGVLRTS
jgi:uncharacterized protein (TIGR03382 family)